MTPRTRAAAVALVAMAVLAACSGAGDELATTPAGAAGLETLAPGDPLAAVSLPKLDADDPERVDMGQLGAPAVVNFWATWCTFCVDEMPDFEAVHVELGDKVRFIGVDREDFAERARTFADELGVSYELVQDLDGSFFRSAKGRGMPTTLFVDAAGIIRYRHAGPLSQDQLRDLIEQYLDIGAA